MKYSIEQLGWIAREWCGEALGGDAEETWMEPVADIMLGMFRLIRDNTVVFYELMSFEVEGDNILLRVKHFNPGMKGWEEKDKSLTFILQEVTQDKAVFNGLVFNRDGDDGINIELLMKTKGKMNWVTFNYKRKRS